MKTPEEWAALPDDTSQAWWEAHPERAWTYHPAKFIRAIQEDALRAAVQAMNPAAFSKGSHDGWVFCKLAEERILSLLDPPRKPREIAVPRELEVFPADHIHFRRTDRVDDQDRVVYEEIL